MIRNEASPEYRRSPQGECGLKYAVYADYCCPAVVSLPARGVWIEIQYDSQRGVARVPSLPARGVWIEIARRKSSRLLTCSRSPQGECGLKSFSRPCTRWYAGRSPQGECGLKYCIRPVELQDGHCRSPQGECGLKYEKTSEDTARFSRSPQGECGLKLADAGSVCERHASLPARGVWIEIACPERRV